METSPVSEKLEVAIARKVGDFINAAFFAKDVALIPAMRNMAYAMLILEQHAPYEIRENFRALRGDLEIAMRDLSSIGEIKKNTDIHEMLVAARVIEHYAAHLLTFEESKRVEHYMDKVSDILRNLDFKF